MKPRDLKQLLGGFAAGTLTSEEREALFQAALEDQTLFDALAEEEPLRELLADPVARAQLLGELRERPQGFWRRLAGGLRKPATLALAGTAAALLLVVGAVRFAQRETQPPRLVAQAPRPLETPPPAAVVQRPEAKTVRRAAPPPPAPALEAKRAEKEEAASLSWAVLVRDAEGAWREAPTETTFSQGDQVRLRVRSAEDGYVAITVQDGSSVTSLGPPSGMPVRGGQDLVVPPTGALALTGTSGEKLLRLSFSTGAMVAPDVGMQFARGAGAPAAAKTAAKASPPAQQIELRLVYRPAGP